MAHHRFHHAFPVKDLASTRQFYADTLGCKIGRQSQRWIDLDFYGHQLSAHVVSSPGLAGHNPVDGDQVPIPHFGVILDFDQFDQLRDRLEKAGTEFVIPPRIRFAGEPGEQRTMFFYDPSFNAIEIKAFARDEDVFRF